MKKIKQIDMIVQLVLVVAFAMAALLDKGKTIIIGYFIVGSWQLASMLVHHVKDWHMHKKSRQIYHGISYLSVFMLALATVSHGPIQNVFWILLLAAPVMAVYYLLLCVHEIVTAEKRPSEIII
ncbi:hypothetical protein [Aridibaculum aurantiacum]|uniref:hypothetical protein n=1 Tax=Aridibaculum aurantiacum TaxID=2810307 RepID=UPI001A962EE5|nr:hypothetical protein [Aridibaculum aurantiacum]